MPTTVSKLFETRRLLVLPYIATDVSNGSILYPQWPLVPCWCDRIVRAYLFHLCASPWIFLHKGPARTIPVCGMEVTLHTQNSRFMISGNIYDQNRSHCVIIFTLHSWPALLSLFKQRCAYLRSRLRQGDTQVSEVCRSGYPSSVFHVP
jgi:hypothetical protein